VPNISYVDPSTVTRIVARRIFPERVFGNRWTTTTVFIAADGARCVHEPK
jgi:hypothetical protein